MAVERGEWREVCERAPVRKKNSALTPPLFQRHSGILFRTFNRAAYFSLSESVYIIFHYLSSCPHFSAVKKP